MNLKAIFPEGITALTVHGLHQWDYGRSLEIQSNSLTGRGVVQIHFACAGMSETIIRTGTVTGTNKLTAAIPDNCLEQSAPITAWVFIPGVTEGYTMLTVTMPITARPRPAETPTEPPEDYSNQYTQLIETANDLVDACNAQIAATNALRENTYTRTELGAVLGSYITEIDALIGGDA